MSWRDRIPTFGLTSGETNEEIVIYEPEARDTTTNIILAVAISGIAVMLLVEIGILSEDEFRWLPLGVILALMAANPIVKLKGIWEAITILLMYTNFMSYLIVYHSDDITNSMMLSTALLLVIFVIEYPRRFSIE